MSAPAAEVASFPHRKAGHCGSGALRDLLEFYGLSYRAEPLSEGMVFGLGGGLGFFFAEHDQLDPPMYLVGRTAGLERDLCSHLGIDLDLRQTDDPAQGWHWLRDELDAGHPTMVWADIKHLDYLRVRLNNTMHDIVVTGYDEDQGIALIADNDRDEIQRCSLESLAIARDSHSFPGPNRHATWVMRFPDRLPDLLRAVNGAVDRAVRNMREENQLLDGAGNSGLRGIVEFAERYPEWPDRLGDRLQPVMRGLQVFIVKAGTGGAMFRSLHAQFLHDSSELLADQRLAAAAGLYDSLTDAWVGLAAAAENEDPEEGHRAGLSTVARIAELERLGVEAMERWLSTREAQ